MLVSLIFGYVYGMHMTFEKIRSAFGEDVWRKMLEGLHYEIEHGDSEEDEE